MTSVYSRWGKELGSDEQFISLKNKLGVLFSVSFYGKVQVTEIDMRLLALTLGRPINSISSIGQFNREWYLEITKILDAATTPFDLAIIIEALLGSVSKFNGKGEAVANLVNNSHCGIRMAYDGEYWITYPSGEKKLDRELVEKPLSFLDDKPLKEYEKALEHYSSSQPMLEECSEKVRRTLEEYLRQKLATKKGLDSAVAELGSNLEVAGIPEALRTMIIGIFKKLDTHFNNVSKHQSRVYNEAECEFLIYQAGLLMNLIEKVWK